MRRYFYALLLSVLLSGTAVQAFAEQAVVTGEGVNVRNGPGTAYGISASVGRGQEVQVLDLSDPDWYLISWDGKSGYVSSQFLALSEEDSSAVISVSREETAGTIDGNRVCFRSGPSTSSAILGTYDTGKPLTVTGSSGEWLAVRIDGKDGFVFSSFVKEDAPSSAAEPERQPSQGGTLLTPVGAASAAPASGSSTVFTVQEELTVSPEETLPPDQIVQVPTDGTVHMVMPAEASEEAILTFEEEGGAEAGADSSGTLISVAEPRLIQEFTPSPEPPASPELSPTPESSPTPEPSPSAAPGQTESPDEDAETAGPASAADAPRLKLGRVTGSGVRLRTGPGSTYSILGTYDTGTEVAVTGVSGDWTAVTLPATGVSGFIHSDFIEGTESDDQDAAGLPARDSASGNFSLASEQMKDGYVTGSSVRLRESPSMSARILDEMNYGTAVRITGISDGWYRVIANGREGYVSASFVEEGVYEPAAGLSGATGTVLGKDIAAYALQFVGTPYKWGGKSPETGFDCSGFVQYVFGQFGYTTSRVANDALSDGVHVDPSDLQPGDMLCFFSGSNYVGHLGIYVGDDLFVHAANSSTGVVTTSLTTGYYAERGYEIRRIT